MPHSDELRGEVFDVRLDTALDIRKASKTESIDLAFAHCACSAKTAWPIIAPGGELSLVAWVIADVPYCLSDRHPAQQ